jgi:hypothetical protein
MKSILPSPMAKRTLTVLDRVTLEYLSKAHYGVKTASTEIIGTNKKPDVMRVLRTQGLLEYSGAGTEHEILEPGHRYFVTDNDRRNSSTAQLVPHAKLPGIWNEKPGTEIYISGRNALELKRDHFDKRIMDIIDPPRASRRNGLRMDELLAKLDSLDELPVSTDEEVPLSEQLPERNAWLEMVQGMAASGNEAGARALQYLSSSRTMAMINELGQRAGVNLGGAGREQHLYRFCSYRMRYLLDCGLVFPSDELKQQYLDQVAEVTAEVFLGYSPEAVM